MFSLPQRLPEIDVKFQLLQENMPFLLEDLWPSEKNQTEPKKDPHSQDLC